MEAMTRYKCIRGIVLPNSPDSSQHRGTRYLPGEVFESDPTGRVVGLNNGSKPVELLDYLEKTGIIIRTDEALTGPGRESGQAFPVEKFREDGSIEEPEPEMSGDIPFDTDEEAE
jgi:hypothetical protein